MVVGLGNVLTFFATELHCGAAAEAGFSGFVQRGGAIVAVLPRCGLA